MRRLILAATSSNVGKTTITIGLIEAMKRRGKKIAAFKSGPDYIDPMFHKKALGVDSYNLDLFLMGENYCKGLLMEKSQEKDIAIIEGAMGYYDGIAHSVESSAYDLGRKTLSPVILVVNPKGMGASFGALVKGFLDYRPDNTIKGILLNQTKPMMGAYYEKILRDFSSVPIIGCLPPMDNIHLESRHLGLVTANEIKDLGSIIGKIAEEIEKHVDLDLLWDIIHAPELTYEKDPIHPRGKVRVAIARDEAFCFYYEDSVEKLEEAGVEWVEFSPLRDKKLPENIQGLYVGGGYPELYMDQLHGNKGLLKQIGQRYKEKALGLLCECGGFMTLLDSFKGDKDYELMGLIPGYSQMNDSLGHFGYIEMLAQEESLLAEKGQTLKGHEFHYSTSTNEGQCFLAQKPMSPRSWKSVHGGKYLYAGYPHIHLASNYQARERFIQALLEIKEVSR